MKNTLQIIGTLAAIIILIDILGFTAWAMSGQRPADDFYVGSITTHVLRAVIK